jgi:hypothetical protein
VKPGVLDNGGTDEQAEGWCPAYYDVNGAPLKTVYKTWSGLNPRLLTSQETQYANGQADETTWSY